MNILPDNQPQKLISPGEIYKLGDHLLACGDCKDINLVDKLVTGGGNIRLILTDPPYGVAYVENKEHFKSTIGANLSAPRQIVGDELRTDDQYAEFTKSWITPILKNLEVKNAFYIFNCDMMMCSLRQGMKQAGLYYSQMIIWVKNNIVIGRKDYNPQHEVLAYGWYGRHKFERAKGKSVIFHAKPHHSKLHPTMKPVGLLRKFILNSSKTNDIVYDPFGGSGSTLMACEQTKRKCLMIEIDPFYCQVIIDRWEKLTNKTAEIKL